MTPSKFQRDNDVWHLKKTEAAAALPMPTLRGSDWAKEPAHEHFRVHAFPAAEWYVECQARGLAQLVGVVEIDPARRNGVPVLYGTRFTVAQVLAELADTSAVETIAEEFDLRADAIRDLLNGFSLIMQRPCFDE